MTITLSSGTLTLGTSMTIDGTGHNVVIDGNCTVDMNSNCTGGGAIVFRVTTGVTVTLNTLTIQHGRNGGAYGGGIENNGTLFVTNSTLANNTAVTAYGGAINNESGAALTVTNSTFANNTVGIYGSAISNFGTLHVTGSTFSGNAATVTYGGAIANLNSAVATVTSSIFTGNSASGPGAGITIIDGNVTVTNSLFSNNTAGNGGGAIINVSGVLTIANSTFTGNHATTGGAIEDLGTLTLMNNTFAGNSASSNGGALYKGGTLTAKNNLFVNSTGGDVSYSGTLDSTNITGSFTFADANNTPVDHGGPTPTLALPPGSPALGAGDGLTCAAAPVSGKDQRGQNRPDSGTCDIGAFESQGFTIAKTGGDMQSIAIGSPFTALTATVTSSEKNVTITGGTLTFVIVPGTGTATFGAAGSTRCTVSMDKLTASGCTVNAMGVATSPPFTGTTPGAFTITASATPGDAPGATFNETASQATPMVSVVSSSMMNTSVNGTSVTFTATVAGIMGGATPTGTVAFTSSDGTTLMSGTLMPVAMSNPTAATASVTTNALKVGMDTITATYNGDSNYTGGMNTVTQTVTKATPAVTVTSTPNPSAQGVRVTFTATVTGIMGGPPPTGSVTFTSGGVTLGMTTLDAMGNASIMSSSLPVGMDAITASYGGDAAYLTSSGMTTQNVTNAMLTMLMANAPTGSGSGNRGTASMPVLAPGTTLTLSVTGTYTNGMMGSVSGVMYRSSDPTKVAVDGSGKVTALTAGTATITVTGPNGVMTTITVTVATVPTGRLTNPNAQPMAHATIAPPVSASATPMPQPNRAGSGGGAVQPQGTNSTPGATPRPQPASH